MKPKQDKTIVLVGGDTGGPIAPLLALASTIQDLRPDVGFLVVGTKWGVEGRMSKALSLPFVHIAATKLHRFLSWRNLFSPFIFVLSLIQSYRLLKRVAPVCVVGAGSFVQVPVMYAAWILGVPVFVHQQDVVPGLANKLCAPIASKITVTFEKSLEDFPQSFHLVGTKVGTRRVIWTGNPCRELNLVARTKALAHFGLDIKYPTLLVLGGGGGALWLNQLVAGSAYELTKYMNVLHVTGRGRNVARRAIPRYKTVEFLDEMEYAYSLADIVLCRAGLGTITELSRFKLPAVLVPIPGSHQEQNALYLRKNSAALSLNQSQLRSDNLVLLLRNLLFEQQSLDDMGQHLHRLMPAGASANVAKVILSSLTGKI